jgi:hypothetical protein
MGEVETVLDVLEAGGYKRLPKPLIVSGAAFDFDAAVIGTGVSHDLVVVSGAMAELDRLAMLVTGLGRRLDVSGSKRPVTLVLIGTRPPRTQVRRLESYARLLFVDNADPNRGSITQALAVLLPLTVQPTGAESVAPIDELAQRLGARATEEQVALLAAASRGESAVRAVLAELLEAAFVEGAGGTP